MNPSKHVYIKGIYFERNIDTQDLEVRVESNHGDFILRDDVLDMKIIYSVLDYLKSKATDVIQRWLADNAQKELEKSAEDRAREALGLNLIEVDDEVDNG